MKSLRYTFCHGSGNRFALIDAVAQAAALSGEDPARLARLICHPERGVRPGGLDGLLLLVKEPEGYAMRMFNTDGSEAEMCGNGIRCVARMAYERYLHEESFSLRSGGRAYPVEVAPAIGEGVPTYGVEIAIRRKADDFPRGGEEFLDQPIAELDPALRFSYLNLGNPHIVALVEEIDYTLLEQLGERVKQLPAWFPRGVNVSLVRCDGEQRIFVATCERGVGLTNSCGTAMTASTTASVLLGRIAAHRTIDVCNRGGMVRCEVVSTQPLVTRLVGNATYESEGELWIEDDCLTLKNITICEEEAAAYNRFVAQTSQN